MEDNRLSAPYMANYLVSPFLFSSIILKQYLNFKFVFADLFLFGCLNLVNMPTLLGDDFKQISIGRHGADERPRAGSRSHRPHS